MTEDPAAPGTGAGGASAAVAPSYGDLPLGFEQNRGQTSERVDYLVRAPGQTAFLTPTGATLALQPAGREASGAAIRLELVGADPGSRAAGLQRLPGEVNVIRGEDPSRWTTGAPTFARVRYAEVYPGIDVAWYGTQGKRLEYDFVLKPGAEPERIGLQVEGARRLALDGSGGLRIETAAGTLVQRPPVAFQRVDGHRAPVDARYHLAGDRVGLAVGGYDRTRPLVIDPVLDYSTFVGGSGGEGATDLAIDGDGNAYITGTTPSSDFPTTPGAFDEGFNAGFTDAYVAKLNPSGSGLVYSTFLGGSDQEFGGEIAVDADGQAYVTGFTQSTDFPTTPGALDTSANGGGDAFVATLDASGAALGYSTLFGGTMNEVPSGIDVDADGSAHVVGSTESSDLPTTPGVLGENPAGGSSGFVLKLSPSGTDADYATYIGGSDSDSVKAIEIDADGSAHLAGDTQSADFPTTAGAFDESYNDFVDGFVAELSPDGSDLENSTFLGGDGGGENLQGIALGSGGETYVTGFTGNNPGNFPTTPGAFDESSFDNTAFVVKLDPALSSLAYSTFFGGNNEDTTFSIALDGDGNAYITGYSESSDLPLTPDALDATFAGGRGDAFVTIVNPTGRRLLYSSWLGGDSGDTGFEIAVDPTGENVHVAGGTGSSDFPTTGGAYDEVANSNDAFVSKFSDLGNGPGIGPPPITSASEFLPPGGTISTNSVTSGDDPVGTSVTTPVEGDVSIDEVATTTPDPGGYTLLGQQVEITAPDASAADPLVLGFRLDASLLGPGEDETTVQVFRNGVLVPECDGGAGSSASPDPCVASRSATPEGIELVVRTSQASNWNFGVASGDSDPPETTIDSGPSGPTNDSTPSFTFSSDEPGSSFECRFDAGSFGPCSGPGDAHTAPSALSQGAHTFEVRATDAADNVDDSPASRSFTVDKVAPQTSITSGPSGRTNDSTPSFGLASSEASSSFECRIDSGPFLPCSGPGSTHTTASLSDGSHTLRVRATDPAGNTDPTPASRTFTVDTRAPQTKITSGPSGNTRDRTPTFKFRSSEPSGDSFQCALDGASFSTCSSPKRYSTLSYGTHTFRVRARDAAGNLDPTPASRTFKIKR